MNINLQNITEYVERHLNGDLSPAEWQQIQAQLQANEALQAAWDERSAFLKIVLDAAKRRRFKSMMQQVIHQEKQAENNTPVSPAIIRPLSYKKYLKMGGIAAAIALFSSVATYQLATNKSEHASKSQYQTLSKKIEALKDSQTRIIKNISSDKGNAASTPAMPGNFGGSGFAITNDGYVATDYHVVDGADSIFIQVADGSYLKAYIVAFEPASDVAILKVEDNSFRFGKGPLPYTIAKMRSELAQPVYTLGYPEDDIVYNEGYISSQKGYNGDTNSYMLEITANPGQSGSPVFDQNGNIIALVTAKETNATYAIQSTALVDLVKTLPKATKIHLPEHNKISKLKRTEQVKRAKDYMCAVKVYK
jgi:serine protease Do